MTKIRWLGITTGIILSLLLGSMAAVAQDNTYTVQPGDTLFSIARAHSISVEQLSFANGITNPDLIYVGQILTIPGGSAEGGDSTTYTVAAGDTLFSIARRFGTTVAQIVEANNLTNPDAIGVGQVLVIPGAPAVTDQPTSEEEITHVVAPGETLGQIALRYGTTYQQIAALNNLSNPNLIYAGQELIIRQGSVPTPTLEPTTETPAPTEEETETPAPTEETATPEPTEEETETPAPTEETTTPEPTEEETETPVSTEETTTPEPTEEETETSVPTEETETPVVTDEPTVTVEGDATPTQVVVSDIPEDASNLLTNPGFEGEIRSVIFEEVKVFQGWEPFYCDQPYTPQKCPAPRQGSGNPADLLMRRPEYKATNVDNRVHSGATAQQWFCFFGTCRAGVYQTVETTPGALCEVGAYVQSWSSNGNGFTSDLSTQDERDNSTWFIKVNLSGDTFAFSDANLVSRGFGFEDGIYDQYVKISFQFTANSSLTTVFFENLRLWPIANNDNYIDDAYVRCSE